MLTLKDLIVLIALKLSIFETTTMQAQNEQYAWNITLYLIIAVFCIFIVVNAVSSYLSQTNHFSNFKGPQFVEEEFKSLCQSSQIDFYNSSGAVINCKAKGDPKPSIRWIKSAETFSEDEIEDIVNENNGLRYLREDGSMILLPFSENNFRKDVHMSIYRCIASNQYGSIVSANIKVRAAIKHRFTIQTPDQFVIIGNTEALTCNIPNFMTEILSVKAWQRNDGLIIEKYESLESHIQSHIHVTDDGSLFFEKVDEQDANWKYRCIVRDKLSGESYNSASWAKLILTEAKIKSAPKIITPYKEYVYKRGDNAQIGCIAQANPSPSFFWLKEDPITSSIKFFKSHRSILTLNNVQSLDSGTYLCLVNNTLGEDQKRIKITIIEPLKVSIKPDKLIIGKEGDSITMECLINDQDQSLFEHLSIEWIKNLNKLYFDSRIKLLKPNVLHIASMNKEDKGMYQCMVNRRDDNQLKAIASLHLSLYEEKPEFREKFYSKTFKPGSQIYLKCSATGSPLPLIRWFHYNKLLNEKSYLDRKRIIDYIQSKGFVTSYLNITNVNIEEGGIYSCEAVNNFGTVKHSSFVHILGSPFVHQIDNLTIAMSDQIDIPCPYSGYPISEIIWTKDGKKFLDQRRIRAYPNGTLSILDAHIEDQGWFNCEVKNRNGQFSRESFYISILEKPSINPFIFGSDLKEGMRTTVVCSIVSGQSSFIIDWFKNDIPIQEVNPRVETVRLGEFTSSLKIVDIKRDHRGNYTCKASYSKAPYIFSTYTAPLIVQVSPKWIIKPLEKYLVLKGSKVIIDCQAEGVPPPVHQWKRALKFNTSPITEFVGIVSGPHIHVLENGSLALIDANKFDENDYVCEISNNVGTPISSISRIEVKNPVHFAKNFELIKAKLNNKVDMICDSLGDQPIDIIWTKSKDSSSNFLSLPKYSIHQEIHENGIISKLTIASVTQEDSAFFTCSASNPYGNNEKNIQLRVQGPPQAPHTLKAIDVQNREVTISWLPSNDGNSPLQDYLIQYTKNNDTWSTNFDSLAIPAKDTSVVIGGLLPMTYYKIRVIGQNSLGYSEPSKELVIKTLEEAPTEAPSNVRIDSIKARSLKIRWLPPVISTIPQKIEGFYIGYREMNNLKSSQSHDIYTYKKFILDKNVEDNYIVISDLKPNTVYGIIVQAYNRQGTGPSSTEIIGQTLEYDPPSSVIPKVIDVTRNSLSLAWEIEDDNPISGFIVNYKTDVGNWEEHKVIGYHNSFTLNNLRCGTKYLISVSPFNKAGKAQSSELISASTAGAVPSIPSLESLIVNNWSSIVIKLDAWIEKQCPIISFIVQYKIHNHIDWILLSNNIIPEQGQIYITDLNPATWYDLLMIANSEAGSSEAQYRFATLTIEGATIPPPSAVTENSWQFIVKDPLIIIPFTCTLVIAIIIVFIILYVSYHGCYFQSRPAQIINQGNYFASTRNKCENLNMSSFSSKSDDLMESLESHYSSCRIEPKLSFVSSINCDDPCDLIGPHMSRICSDHVYDMPQRFDLNNTDASKTIAKSQLIVL